MGFAPPAPPDTTPFEFQERRRGKAENSPSQPRLRGGRRNWRGKGNLPPSGWTPGPTLAVPPTRPRVLRPPPANLHPSSQSRRQQKKARANSPSFSPKTYFKPTPTTDRKSRMSKLKGARAAIQRSLKELPGPEPEERTPPQGESY